MNLTQAVIGQEYLVKDISTEDEELNEFLFTLGCYSGEPVTVVSQLHPGYFYWVQDGRYNIDKNLAQTILI